MDGQEGSAKNDDAPSGNLNAVPNEEEVSEKRPVTMTAKGYQFYIETLQKERKARYGKASQLLKQIEAHMKNENVKDVHMGLKHFLGHCNDAAEVHFKLIQLSLPEEELKRQEKWYKTKASVNNQFVDHVIEWLSKHGVQYKDEEAEDDVKPEDSVSNITKRLSHLSTASSAARKAQAERAALLERAAALEAKHALEVEEENIRRKKEKLAMEIELKATEAKIQVLEGSVSSQKSRRDDMNAYFDKAKSQTSMKILIESKTVQQERRSAPASLQTTARAPASTQPPDTVSYTQDVRPKEPRLTTRVDRAHQGQQTGTHETMNTSTRQPSRPILDQRTPRDHQTRNQQFQTQTQVNRGSNNLPSSAPDDNSQSNIHSLLRNQNEITALLVRQQIAATLPQREIPVFDGNPMEYGTFIKAFEHSIEKKTDNSQDCLYFLEQFTKGKPKELVKGCQYLPPNQGYERAKQLLKTHFGNESKIASSYLEKAYAWPTIKPDDANGLQSYAFFLRECCTALEEMESMEELNVTSNMRIIMMKMPYRLRERWRVVACELQEHRGYRALFHDLVNFIEKQVKIMSDPLFGDIHESKVDTGKRSLKVKGQKYKESSFATVTADVEPEQPQTVPGNQKDPCLCCQGAHLLGECNKLKRMMHKDKIVFLKEKGICFGCLKRGHMSKDCKGRLICKVCNAKHPSILHIQFKEKESKTDQQQESPVSSALITLESCGHTGAGEEDDCVLSIVPVQVKSQKGDRLVQTYAFLDPGSTATFCTDNLLKQLNLTGTRKDILLRTMGQNKLVSCSALKGLEVSKLDGGQFHHLPEVITQATMPVSRNNAPKQKEVQKWPYLNKIKIKEIDKDVDLLIGTNAPHLMEPLEVINSRENGPYAVRTQLGWVVNGPLRSGNDNAVNANRISVVKIEELLISQYNQDFNEKTSEEKLEMSREDVKFMNIMDKSVKLKEGHYCLDLPFRNDNPTMPNNRNIALQRLQNLKKKFRKDLKYQQDYAAFLNDVIDKGYAEIVPPHQLQRNDSKIWYLPHHGVYHPQKKSLRVVFDCAADFQGVSLNSQLLQGPDLTNTLLGVLVRFREEHVALMADIQAMFHQVKVSEKDVDFLRFLWWPDGDCSKDPIEYRMLVHLFGATSSPSCANYALRKTAEDNKDCFSPVVCDTVHHNFYVDDCLKSLPSKEEAVQMVQDLANMLQKGGFHLSKWITNSRTVLASIAEEKRSKTTRDLDLDKDNLPMERALGLYWCVETDTFQFRTSVEPRPCSRRGILSVISSIYDPLGFLAPFILPPKRLLQEMCKKNISWDDEVPPAASRQWQEWLADLKRISGFKVPRCIKDKSFGVPECAQLHHFSDASEYGYGTVSYLRLTSKAGVQVAFLLGKSRVAPMKQTTIPRLELTAAVLAVRVDKMLKKELSFHLETSVFWTDSTTVLKYIASETTRFLTFVANRVAIIREATDLSQWRYISTKTNPADHASRGLSADRFLTCKKWIEGPEFLLKAEKEWPKLTVEPSPISSDDPNVKKNVYVNAVTVNDTKNATLQLLSYFSDWTKLRIAVAWFLKFKTALRRLATCRREMQALDDSKMTKLKAELKGQSVTAEDVSEAETAIVRFSQKDKFSVEIANLQKRKAVKGNSDISRLDPMLEDGLLKVGGRLSKAVMPEEVKHPVILSKDQFISKLILQHIHKLLGHAGRNHMLSTLRKKYWITNANTACRKIISDCVICRRYQGKLGEQKMSDLPQERLIPNLPPFTNTGVDYFGPIEVKKGRSMIKRYGVIFTCMASRAIHIEVAYSLDTSSCVNAVRRFICRRGQVVHLRSDNGTNFIGAERELREALSCLDHSKIQRALLSEGLKWSFNTPAGSHHGGVWERLIRLVKKVLYSVLREQQMDDESLHTIMCEIEAILNDRPITRVSDDPNDLEALTPNHLLLLKRKPSLPPGIFKEEDLYARKRWRQVQYMADLFWKRWLKEYLPLLQDRQRWNTTKRSFTVGDLVIIMDPTAPRGSWLMGKIVDTYPDKRGLVRSVKLRTKTGHLDRPINKICLLQEAAEVADSTSAAQTN